MTLCKHTFYLRCHTVYLYVATITDFDLICNTYIEIAKYSCSLRVVKTYSILTYIQLFNNLFSTTRKTIKKLYSYYVNILLEIFIIQNEIRVSTEELLIY